MPTKLLKEVQIPGTTWVSVTSSRSYMHITQRLISRPFSLRLVRNLFRLGAPPSDRFGDFAFERFHLQMRSLDPLQHNRRIAVGRLRPRRPVLPAVFLSVGWLLHTLSGCSRPRSRLT